MLFRVFVLRLQGDRCELTNTLGLASWHTWSHPGMLCECSKEEMRELYDEVDDDGDMPLALKVGDYHERACVKCEVNILIATEGQHADLLVCIGWDPSCRIAVHQTVASYLDLRVADRLAPSPELPDIAGIEHINLGTQVKFRRRSMEGQSCADRIRHRCPLFMTHLHMTPSRIVANDILHTMNFGPLRRYCSAALWRIISANPSRLPFSSRTAAFKEIGCRRLSSDLHYWYTVADIPHDRHISDLTPNMLGRAEGALFHTSRCGMSVKAAEVTTLLKLSVHMLETLGDAIPDCVNLAIAANGLLQWNDLTHNGDRPQCWRLQTTHCTLQEPSCCGQRIRH